MSRWLLITVAILVLLPVALMTGVGGWVLWTSGHWTWLKWSIPVCWTAAWLAIRFSKPIELPILEIGSKIHWTPQDHAAASLIEVEQKPIAVGFPLAARQGVGDPTKKILVRLVPEQELDAVHAADLAIVEHHRNNFVVDEAHSVCARGFVT